MNDWVKAFEVSKLPVGGSKLFKQGTAQVAVFRVAEDELYAVDNRCPHEGYPLIQGARDGCTLTCCFHNFKFNLKDGDCIKGGEAVRTYPVRIDGDQVSLDLTPPDPCLAIPGLWKSLAEALFERRIGQATRDCARLLQAGILPEQLSSFVAAWNGIRAPWGSTHVLALSNDVLQWKSAFPGPQFAIPFAQVLDLAGRDGARRQPREPAAATPVTDPVRDGVRFREAVEAEDMHTAERILNGALEAGWQRTELEPWFFQLQTDHFISFGHRLIYQVKVFDLLEAAGWDRAGPILRGHLFGILSGTREDVLPSWSGFRKRLEKLDLVELYARAGGDSEWSDEGLLNTLVHGRAAESFDAITQALQQGAPLTALVDQISIAAAERMLRFDIAIDSDDNNQDNWLSITHIQTYAHAVRHAIERHPQAEVLRLIYFAARMVNHHKVLDGSVSATPATDEAGQQALIGAIGRKDTDCALALATQLLCNPASIAPLRTALMRLAISDHFSVPIVSAHAMKNLLVAFEETRITGDHRHILALIRLLASPLQQRWTHRSAREAVAFVVEGKTPNVLAP